MLAVPHHWRRKGLSKSQALRSPRYLSMSPATAAYIAVHPDAVFLPRSCIPSAHLCCDRCHLHIGLGITSSLNAQSRISRIIAAHLRTQERLEALAQVVLCTGESPYRQCLQ